MGTFEGCVLIPPLDQGDIVGCRMVYFPIYLRHVVIYPAFFYPVEDVGIKVVIVLQAVGIAAGTVGCAFLVTVDTEGTDAETHPGFGEQDGPFQFADQRVHVLPAPVTALCIGITFVQSVFLETLIVGERHAGCRIGVEIVVHMDGVHIVTADNVAYYLINELAAFGQSRVEQNLFIIGNEPFRMFVINM